MDQDYGFQNPFFRRLTEEPLRRCLESVLRARFPRADWSAELELAQPASVKTLEAAIVVAATADVRAAHAQLRRILSPEGRPSHARLARIDSLRGITSFPGVVVTWPTHDHRDIGYGTPEDILGGIDDILREGKQ